MGSSRPGSPSTFQYRENALVVTWLPVCRQLVSGPNDDLRPIKEFRNRLVSCPQRRPGQFQRATANPRWRWRAAWPHFGSQGWPAHRAGLVESVRISAGRAPNEVRVWHLPRPPTRPPHPHSLVLLCLPVDRFLSRCAVRNKKRPPGRQRQKQWNIKATTTTATAHPPPAMAQPAASPATRLPAVKTGSLRPHNKPTTSG